MRRKNALITHPYTGTHLLRALMTDALKRHGPRVNECVVLNFGEPDPGDRGVLFFEHYDMDRWPAIRDRLEAEDLRPIIPVRDPLLAAISHHSRKSHLKTSQWVRSVADFRDVAPIYVPMDTGVPTQLLVESVMGAVDLVEPSFLRRWVEDWPAGLEARHGFNSSGDNDLKQMYKARDIAGLTQEMPYAVGALKANTAILRPWLEALGYRDLIWW